MIFDSCHESVYTQLYSELLHVLMVPTMCVTPEPPYFYCPTLLRHV
jgi:hypothetical protein